MLDPERIAADAAAVTAVIAAVGAGAGLTVKLLRLLRRLARLVDVFEQIPGRMDRVEVQVGDIREQMHTNGGSTLRDEVKRIARVLDVEHPPPWQRNGTPTS
jgi:hypothetical protein